MSTTPKSDRAARVRAGTLHGFKNLKKGGQTSQTLDEQDRAKGTYTEAGIGKKGMADLVKKQKEYNAARAAAKKKK